jgi:2-polyprenyl-3-methyl-5-hydroxy-6-metoxy-1,4-benzoquinol methylase
MIDPGYYENERRDVARLVPERAQRILDVGCGSGKLGALLKTDHPHRHVTGMEMNTTVAAEAGSVLDAVVVGDIQHMSLPFPSGSFDCIIFADVLEHTVDPASILRTVRPLLAPEGIIVCSIPNMRHYTAILQLIRKGWEYTDYGLFDRTHLRFFSRRSMERLLQENGFRIQHCEPRIAASRKLRAVNALTGGALTELLAMQYLFVAHT